MNWIEKITKENFNASFNLQNILEESVFYPASGIDGSSIEGMDEFSFSFIHVDYSIPKEEVKSALERDFISIGYNLIGIKYVSKEELTPEGWMPHLFELQESEEQRMHYSVNSKKNLEPFALWAIFELKPKIQSTKKIKRFSLLHIGGEAVATFDALYVAKKINPLAITIVCPSEGYGDNWTSFRDPNYRLYKLIRLNVEKNNQEMPKYIYTKEVNDGNCFWPDYQLISRQFPLTCQTFMYRGFNK